MKTKQRKSSEDSNRQFDVADTRASGRKPPDASEYVRAQELRGKFRGKGLLKELMAEKNREKGTS
jgi:hypothetical protein